MKSQSASFQLSLDSTGYVLEDVMVNENDEIVALIRDTVLSPERKYYLLPVIANQPGPMQGFAIRFPFRPGLLLRTFYHGKRIYFVNYISPPGLYPINIFNCVDMETGIHWTKKSLSSTSRGPNFIVDDDGNAIVIGGVNNIQTPYFDSTNVVELFKLDPLGNTLWKKGMVFKDVPDGGGIAAKDIKQDSEGNLYVFGILTDNTVFIRGVSFVLKMDSLGNPLIWKTIKDHDFNDLLVTNDGVYLWDQAAHLPQLFNGRIADEQVKLVKFDHDLNFAWGKRYFAENFKYYSASLKKLPSGNLLMTHAASGAYPVILSELDSMGNIISQKGYPNYQPQIQVMNDDSYLISSAKTIDSNGITTDKIVFAKTDPEGNIAGCDTYPTCLQVEDFNIETGTFTIVPMQDVFELEPYDIEIEPASFSFSSFCDYPPPPVPDFDFPDSLCSGDTAFTLNTYNRLAQAREWYLTGPGVDSVLSDSFNFGYRFTTAGTYVLQQKIWVLGCSYEFEKQFIVLPPLEARITPDTICPDQAQELSVSANRSIIDYLWNSEGKTANYPVSKSGVYEVVVNDGTCTAYDTASIFVVNELIGEEPPLKLPPDTTVCEIHLPFRLAPESPYSDHFFSNIITNPTDTVYLSAPGEYQIGMNAFGCTFWADFKLDTSECKVPIYLPNAFSPNGDGINDDFFPMGKDFETLELTIFNRWGGTCYKGSSNDARWNGEGATQGTYVFLLKYRNLLTNKVEFKTGNVMLIR
jgi:gliding motility-associated-like protein